MRQLQVSTLKEQLKKMKEGEVCYAPKGYTDDYIRRICSSLKNEGYVFTTSKKTGKVVVVRLK